MADSLDKLISDELAKDPHVENHKLAEKIFDRVSRVDKVGMLANYIADWRRYQVRKVEHQVPRWSASGVKTATVGPNSTSFTPSFDPLADRRELLTKGAAIPGRGWVRWGEMTVKDHRTRIEMLARIRNGIDRTIQLHIDAIETIESAGVSCLNDLYVSKKEPA